MKNVQRVVLNCLLGALTCLFLVGVSSPAFSRMATPAPTTAQATSLPASLEALATNLNAAESALLAQGMTGSGMMSYGAILRPANVVPKAPMSRARGAVGAVLSGNRLVVRGSFNNLSSSLRNYATDPVDPPNANITSAFHIHRGMPSENGPFQYALQVMLNNTGMGGMAMGEYTLTQEQLQALNNGMLYVDLHTSRNRGGELRGILMPY
ncbi:CHRD domain-containing protein [Pseudanabaena sp. FACHB-2040]|uniref:CHRD domain-containing protein n=1 Tax=Pseudanabaena sp. FACHB-2040 TaxID=2692859 RepID=UPI001688630A|nr:CHRD domain-containing protein [Pseudanabaena sp. FACHB-2040]MBD2258824.1 CHRD domain-containing protein [Pseudanabaena sp. FACHB-2040]